MIRKLVVPPVSVVGSEGASLMPTSGYPRHECYHIPLNVMPPFLFVDTLVGQLVETLTGETQIDVSVRVALEENEAQTVIVQVKNVHFNDIDQRFTLLLYYSSPRLFCPVLS